MSFDDGLTAAVKSLALESGFVRAAIAPAGPIAGAAAFRQWVESGFAAEMNYLAANVDKRVNPKSLVEDARSVICLAVGYMPVCSLPVDGRAAFVGRYARGRDYHKVLKKRAHDLCDRILRIAPDFAGRAFVDTAPVAERSLAAESGLGWIGRNGMLVVPGFGNAVLLAEIVCNLPLRPGEPVEAACGDCTACLSVCPTGALAAEGTLDARKCISYHTIENRGAIPRELWPQFGNSVFGCDRCQSLCPHNDSVPPGDPELLAPPGEPPLTIEDILRWTEADWDAATRGRAMRRATLWMFHRNAVLAAGNGKDASLLGLLDELRSRQGGLDEEIDWAIGQINGF
ncbi:MAG: tRNA epoxyqueuosine(34) reductase QueG [Phycisphaerae bacterium]|nr:tRNA epoxyqueuosine(34) reductase QueG [Phycisphaerae bacterium]